MYKFIFILSLFLIPNISFAHNDEDGDDEVSISKEAIKNYGIEFVTINQTPDFYLPQKAVVSSQDKFFIYKTDGDHFDEIEVKAKKTNQKNKAYKIYSEDIKIGDVVVSKNAKYLRIIFLDKKNKHTGHSH